MRAILLGLMLLFVSGASYAEVKSAGHSVTIGTIQISVGDKQSKVESAGVPDSKTPVMDQNGNQFAEDWHYADGAKDTIVRIDGSGHVIFVGHSDSN